MNFFSEREDEAGLKKKTFALEMDWPSISSCSSTVIFSAGNCFETATSEEIPMEIDDYEVKGQLDQAKTDGKIIGCVADELECAICSDLLKRPKYLQCMHTFCEECLVDLAKSRKGMATLPCPLCRRETPNPTKKGIRKGLKTNFIAARIIEKLNEHGKIREESYVGEKATISNPPFQHDKDTSKLHNEDNKFEDKAWFKTM